MTFLKHEKCKSEKLNLFIQTSNEFSIKRSVERSRKIVFFVFSNLAQIESTAKSIIKHAF